MPNEQAGVFIETRQHSRFVEFANFCRTNRTIGICTGRPGVGKEASGQAYAQWQTIKPLLDKPRRPQSPPAKLKGCHSVYWDAEVKCSLKKLNSSLMFVRNKFDGLVQDSMYWYQPDLLRQAPRKDFLELVIINNAHRLSFDCLEVTNDFRKKYNIGIVLLAVPGFDRKIRLFDPVGCDVALYHEYSPPRAEELRQILEIRWHKEAVAIEDAAITIIEEVTRSNIQKALNIQTEIERVRGINSISIISPELVEAASKSLLLDLPDRSKK